MSTQVDSGDPGVRPRIALLMALAGCTAVGAAFYFNAQRNAANAALEFASTYVGGAPYVPQDAPAVWIATGVAGLLFLGALLTWLIPGRATTPQPALIPGWYDDPDSPARLRYWDGGTWTEKTSNKPDH
ncbi:MAG: DUF2510 domain-containing protein [Actinobacteria bacterium]|uniref:Unannotated protein n=1 Tax=freshwater metagenome TaxID=449393 RepID=A0A6J7LPH1_9ZZZZ|nr:DUF2510 domain-containing protein [Actinomycetota bacterium]